MLDITDKPDSVTPDDIQVDGPASLEDTGFRSQVTGSSWSIWDLISLSDLSTFFRTGELIKQFNNNKNLSIAHQMLATGHLFRVPYSEIFNTLNKNTDFQKYILEMLCHEVFEARRVSVINCHYTADVRLAYFLLNLWSRIDPTGSDTTFCMPMTRVAISDFLGLTPETISRCLASFKKNGWIEARGSEIKLLDIDSLAHLVTGIPA